MTRLQILEEKGKLAVRKLRFQKLSQGHAFMINSKELPTNQCYLEYPDGVVKLATFTKGDRDFTIIRELSLSESDALRKKYNLSAFDND